MDDAVIGPLACHWPHVQFTLTRDLFGEGREPAAEVFERLPVVISHNRFCRAHAFVPIPGAFRRSDFLFMILTKHGSYPP
jgi:hypothetical protein